MKNSQPASSSDPRFGKSNLFDVEKIRKEFPILGTKINDKRLVYLDNAATTQKPTVVLDSINHYYKEQNANIHRAAHTLSQRATEAYETARDKVRQFINANDPREIIFLRGTTEAINLVAGSWGEANIGQGDEIIVSAMEHHSNIVPWQLLCNRKGAHLRVIPMDDSGELLLEKYESLFSKKTKLVSVTHVSNSLGTVNPIRRIVASAHSRGIPVMVDGAQAVPHMAVDVQELGCDFYAFSGHKLFGPTGIGVLYGQAEHLENAPPYQGGGEMIKSVTFEKTTYAAIPNKFEAGTPDIAGAIGMGAAIDYITNIGYDQITLYEQKLVEYGLERLSSINGLTIIGTARQRCSLISFVLDGIHPHDIGTVLDTQGIAVRTGHHCAQPVMDRFRIPATVRASFALYNTQDEVDQLYEGIQQVFEMFS